MTYLSRLRDFMAAHMILSGDVVAGAGSLSSGNSKLLMSLSVWWRWRCRCRRLSLVVMAMGAAKARKRGLEIAEEIKAKLMPVIDGAHECDSTTRRRRSR